MKKKNDFKFKQIFRLYMKGELRLLKYQKIGVMMLMVVLSGIFGWMYEFIFYFFDGGTGEFYMQGGNFLPWINIYAIGAILIFLTTYRLRRYPWVVVLIAMVATGLLELVSGWLIYQIGGGTRYWDYNTEILNFGNIGGFVCLRSVLFFGVSALILMYAMLPSLIWLAKKLSRRAFLMLAISLFTIVMVDEIYNFLAAKVFGWVDATEIYQSMGWKYLKKW